MSLIPDLEGGSAKCGTLVSRVFCSQWRFSGPLARGQRHTAKSIRGDDTAIPSSFFFVLFSFVFFFPYVCVISNLKEAKSVRNCWLVIFEMVLSWYWRHGTRMVESERFVAWVNIWMHACITRGGGRQRMRQPGKPAHVSGWECK